MYNLLCGFPEPQPPNVSIKEVDEELITQPTQNEKNKNAHIINDRISEYGQ
jgi:hypothetical protein